MGQDYSENVVAVIRRSGKISWFRGPPELWVLDYTKWRASYIDSGHDLPELDASDRGGIHIVNAETAQEFLSFVEKYRVDKDVLAIELAHRYPSARSSWDVSDLFPVVFIDFDRKHVSAFYPRGTAFEKYVAEGWTGAFEDFATESSNMTFPDADKFWIREGSDLLALLNRRGRGEQ